MNTVPTAQDIEYQREDWAAGRCVWCHHCVFTHSGSEGGIIQQGLVISQVLQSYNPICNTHNTDMMQSNLKRSNWVIDLVINNQLCVILQHLGLGGLLTTLQELMGWKIFENQWTTTRQPQQKPRNVSGYVCNHGSPSGERDTASPRGRYGERLSVTRVWRYIFKNTTCWPATAHDVTTGVPQYKCRREITSSASSSEACVRSMAQSLGDAVSRSPLGEPWLHT